MASCIAASAACRARCCCRCSCCCAWRAACCRCTSSCSATNRLMMLKGSPPASAASSSPSSCSKGSAGADGGGAVATPGGTTLHQATCDAGAALGLHAPPCSAPLQAASGCRAAPLHRALSPAFSCCSEGGACSRTACNSSPGAALLTASLPGACTYQGVRQARHAHRQDRTGTRQACQTLRPALPSPPSVAAAAATAACPAPVPGRAAPAARPSAPGGPHAALPTARAALRRQPHGVRRPARALLPDSRARRAHTAVHVAGAAAPLAQGPAARGRGLVASPPPAGPPPHRRAAAAPCRTVRGACHLPPSHCCWCCAKAAELRGGGAVRPADQGCTQHVRWPGKHSCEWKAKAGRGVASKKQGGLLTRPPHRRMQRLSGPSRSQNRSTHSPADHSRKPRRAPGCSWQQSTNTPLSLLAACRSLRTGCSLEELVGTCGPRCARSSSQAMAAAAARTCHRRQRRSSRRRQRPPSPLKSRQQQRTQTCSCRQK